MSKIDAIRELHCYKKMYHLMQNTVIECVDICKDPIIKDKLIKAQQYAENIYTGEEYIGKVLTADELIIVLLLSFIREREISKGIGLMNTATIEEAIDWECALRGIDFELTDEMISENINKLFTTENKEKDSEQ